MLKKSSAEAKLFWCVFRLRFKFDTSLGFIGIKGLQEIQKDKITDEKRGDVANVISGYQEPFAGICRQSPKENIVVQTGEDFNACRNKCREKAKFGKRQFEIEKSVYREQISYHFLSLASLLISFATHQRAAATELGKKEYTKHLQGIHHDGKERAWEFFSNQDAACEAALKSLEGIARQYFNEVYPYATIVYMEESSYSVAESDTIDMSLWESSGAPTNEDVVNGRVQTETFSCKIAYNILFYCDYGGDEGNGYYYYNNILHGLYSVTFTAGVRAVRRG